MRKWRAVVTIEAAALSATTAVAACPGTGVSQETQGTGHGRMATGLRAGMSTGTRRAGHGEMLTDHEVGAVFLATVVCAAVGTTTYQAVATVSRTLLSSPPDVAIIGNIGTLSPTAV